MYCVNCGHEVPDDAKFCSQCGQDPRKSQSQPEPQPKQAAPAPAKKGSPLRWIIPVVLLLAVAAAVVFLVLPRVNQPDPALVSASIQLTVAAADAKTAAASGPVNTNTPQPTEEPEEQAPPSEEEEPTPTEEPTEEPVDEGPEQIAFASNRSNGFQIWIINQDGSGLEQLTNISGGACQPSWAPDGSALAFTSPCDGNRSSYPNSSIYSYDMQSGEVTQLVSEAGSYDPAWSPTGQHIAYTSLAIGRSQVFYYFLDTGDSINQSSGTSYEYQPAWSADASRMALVSTTSGDELVYYFDLVDGNRNQLLNSDQSESKFVSSPRFAPDGQGVYYTRTPRSGGFAELFYLPMPGNPTAHQSVFTEAIPGRDVSISPDGAWLAFESWPNTSNHDIWLATSAGQNRTRLTTNGANDFDAAWRP